LDNFNRGLLRLSRNVVDKFSSERKVIIAASQNHLTVTGNTTDVPELKFSNKGNPWVSFTIAWNKPQRNPDGSWNNEAHFFDVTAFGQLAEHVAGSIGKGDRVTVVGHIEQDRWVSPEGQNRSKVCIKADDVSADMRWATVQIERQSGKTVASSVDPLSSGPVVSVSAKTGEEPF